MVDALVLRGDERRGMAAISFGEVPSNLWSGDLWMRKLLCRNRHRPYIVRSIPREVKHLSTWRKIKKAAEWRNISWVAASETEIAQTPHHFWRNTLQFWMTVVLFIVSENIVLKVVGGVVRQERRIYTRKVTKCIVSWSCWKATP